MFAQDSSASHKQRIAIFAPLYLDSAFDAADNYRYSTDLPKYFNPGLEFYEGVQLALDSLSKEGSLVEVFVFDTRSASKKLAQQLAEAAADSVKLIIGYTTRIAELQQMAASAQQMKAPFISVNLPNDGGAYNNPYFVMLNSTLRTYIESMYRYIQKFYPLDDIIVFRKKGQVENLIKSYWDDFGKNTMSVPLKLKYVDLTDSFTNRQLIENLDSNHHSFCISGSLDEFFGNRLAQRLASINQHYPVKLMGMPTFDLIDKGFNRQEFKGLTIIYSVPFYNDRSDKISQRIADYFNSKMFSRPGDIVLQGYESVWRFTHLLLKYKNDIASNLTSKEFNVFREFDIQPVINKKTMTLDYFENKKLFFITWLDGKIKTVN